jgi:hypothetical protein
MPSTDTATIADPKATAKASRPATSASGSNQLREDAIREHFLPLIKALQVDGLAVHLGFPRVTNIPEAMAFLLSSATVNSGERGLAVYRRGTWYLDVPRILERGCSLGEFLNGLTVNYAGCRICPTGQGDAPTTRRHLATREHRTRLLRLLQKHFPPKSFGRFASVLTEGPRR